MGINDFINIVKREGRYGTTGVTTDQITTDVLNATNLRRKRIWAFDNWKWALETLSFPIVVGTVVYSVLSKSGNKIDRITDVIPNDPAASPAVLKPPLLEMHRQEFFSWFASQTASPDIPNRYVNLGMDANGNWQIQVWPSPSQAFTMSGYAKKILKTFAAADVAANAAFDYFPDGVIESILFDGVMSDVERIQGNIAEAARLDGSFEAKLVRLGGEQASVGVDDSPQSNPVPDAYRWRRRNRGGTTVV